MLLLLDLDGVLRRQHAALYQLEADCLAVFEEALRWIPDAADRLLQVVFVLDAEGTIFVIHARPLTDAEKHKFRRRRR